ncbi:hypothetical protein HYPBUDRAFT_107019 [Hyphopichia burtonii NRRL Y-1933]|uniref:Uncharacterized protein n=1 Tax=Hyphopichia burtonii NRRL Y-1933 TaxID=984485 RepID=A0A1E4RLC3_9ASCO|nr:hypothetical protein HYPBUDRAFT_107019 [Hyphopichia burtonii NRRL Y-1933]ODV68036.1 hypothetical protein HYPBUDRAFT_107019 [Hyphopichia burtonii NRRL Y-1933]
MSVGGTIEETANATADTFKSLSLSLPFETTKYTFICLFLTRVLNLKDEAKITQLVNNNSSDSIATTTLKPTKKKRPIEILPGIAIPNDLWLKEDVTIKDVKIKISLLQEINLMLENELESSQNYDKPIEIDLTTLSYYEKLLTAYKFLQMPVRESFISNYKQKTIDLSLKEEEEDELEENDLFDDSKSLMRTSSRTSTSTSNNSNQNQNQNLNSNINYNNGIISTPYSEYPPSNNEISPGTVDEDGKKQQALNNLLAKLKLYHKIKKHRELSSSLNSNTLGHSSFSYSNRNSISTTNTSNSAHSRRRASSTVTTPDFNERSLMQPVRIPMIQFPTLSPVQKQENQKIKLEYYVQLKRLTNIISSMIDNINKSVHSHNLIKLVEFVKNYVFKFIIIDVSQMIIDYGYFKSMDYGSK